MLFIEIEFDGDYVVWAVTEYVEGRRHVIDDGREPVVSDALHQAGLVIETFAPQDLV
jgi:hypothetical protein